MAHCFACPGGGTAALDFPQTFVKSPFRDFLGGTVVKNSPCNAGDMDLIPGQGTKIPHACTPRPHMAMKILLAATRTAFSQINKYKYFLNEKINPGRFTEKSLTPDCFKKKSLL